MDNNAPDYAEWIPEAGGYVANGNVVSKTPQYDSDGKLKLTVDTSVFGDTTPQQSTLKAQPQTANNPLTNNGIFTANIQGSNENANPLATEVGSMASLSENTATTGSAISTPAVNSNIANVKPITTWDEINKGYQDAAARNDYKGMIDYLTAAMNYDGIDRTAQISELWKQRGEKIRNLDDAYLQRLNQATTPEEYNQILSEQQAWRNMVGYQDQIERDYTAKQEEIHLDYVNAWNNSINDITNSILQLTGNIINFQYDPMNDAALNRAQAQVQLRMKNQFAATGMYYSSATQYAITQAISELVPVYEKMAKEELRENLSLLQSTANYLVNLDEYQFNQWKAQIQMQWAENEEKQKEIERAVQNANIRGYYTNEEAALLGIPAGTESYEARAAAQAKQDEIDKEDRKLINDKALERFKTDMDKELAEKQEELNKDYWKYQLNNPKETTSNEGLTYTQLKETLTNYIKTGASQDDVIELAQELGGSNQEIRAALLNAYDDAEKDLENDITNGRTIDQKQIDLNEMLGSSKPSNVLKEAIRYSNGNLDTLSTLLNAVKYPKDDSELSGKNVFNIETLGNLGTEAYAAYLDFIYNNRGTPSQVADNSIKLINDLERLKSSGKIDDEQYNNSLAQFNEDIIQGMVDKAKEAYSDESGTTNEAVKKAMNSIQKYSEAVAGSNAQNKNAVISDAYLKLIKSVYDKKDKEFDYNWTPGNTGKKSKIEAIANIASSVRDNSVYGEKTTMKAVYDTIMDFLDILLGNEGKSAEEVLKSAWFAGY